MTDRLSAKERAKEIVGEVVAGIVQEIEDRTVDSILGPTTKWINDELVPNAATQVSNAEKAAAEAEREPITDKSICQRGHPVACIDTTGNDQSTDFCTVCTQLEAELKPLIGGLQRIGNLVGAPTTHYARELERKELLGRLDLISELVQEALRQNRAASK